MPRPMPVARLKLSGCIQSMRGAHTASRMAEVGQGQGDQAGVERAKHHWHTLADS